MFGKFNEAAFVTLVTPSDRFPGSGAPETTELMEGRSNAALFDWPINFPRCVLISSQAIEFIEAVRWVS